MENGQWSAFGHVPFSLLCPLCKDILKCPKEENLITLQTLLNHLPSYSVQFYQRYICIPLCISLAKKDVRLEVKRHVVDSLMIILAKTKVYEFNLFERIFRETFRLISDTSYEGIAPDAPEELKLSVMKCATVLLSNASGEVLLELYSENRLPLIGYGIFFCLSVITDELFLDLRIAAFNCLLHFCQVHNGIPSDLNFRIKVGDVIMHCLPGIILNLRKVINVDEKQNHKITMLAVRAWSHITAVVMEDYYIPENSEVNYDWVSAQLDLVAFMDKQREGKAEDNTEEMMLSECKGKQRTKEWYTHASKTIFFVNKEVCHLYFPNWKVRQEMVSSIEVLLLNCSRNMKECVPSFVELLLSLSEDEVTDVSQKSRLALSNFSEKCGKSLVEIMEDHFLRITKKLCSSYLGEEDLKIHLNLMCGYLRLFGSDLKRIVKSSIHLNGIYSALIRIITLDYFIISPLEDWSFGTSDTDILKVSIPWKCFKNFKSEAIFMKFKEICRLLSEFGDISIISDHFLYHFHEDLQNRKEITLVINEIFSNVTASSSDCDVVVPIIKRIVTSYLDPEVWEVIKVEDSNPSDQTSTIVAIRNRTVQACLLVEGLGMLAGVATSEKMKCLSLDAWYFRICLYPILERIGHPSPMLSGAGTLAMAHISHYTGMPIAAVLQSNSDYLTHHIVVKLRHASGFSSLTPLNVLTAILEFATPDILINLEKAVISVVDYGFKYENDLKALDCLKCMYVFAKFVNKKFSKENLEGNKRNEIENSLIHTSDTKSILNENNIGVVTQRLIDYQRTRKIANSFIDENQELMKESVDAVKNNKNTESALENEEISKKEESKLHLPKHVDLTITVMKRCLTFISSKETQRKLMAMDILSKGICTVSDCENQLLVLVHKIWGPLSVQFNDTDPLVMNHAFNLLSVIAVFAKNFIRDRTLKKVLPPICSFLLNQANFSLKKDAGSAYRFSQAYKLQLSLLKGLGELAFHLDFQEIDLSEMLTAAAPYLSSLQPQPLQDACINTYKLACRINQDIVWLKLAYLGNLFQKLRPPSKEYKVYQAPNQTQSEEEYHKNVSRLIQSIKCNPQNGTHVN